MIFFCINQIAHRKNEQNKYKWYSNSATEITAAMALLIFAGGPERQALASVPSANGASDIPGRGVEAPAQNKVETCQTYPQSQTVSIIFWNMQLWSFWLLGIVNRTVLRKPESAALKTPWRFLIAFLNAFGCTKYLFLCFPPHPKP